MYGLKVSGDAGAAEMDYSDFSHKGVASSIKDFMDLPQFCIHKPANEVFPLTCEVPADYTADPNYTSYIYGTFPNDTVSIGFWKFAIAYPNQSTKTKFR